MYESNLYWFTITLLSTTVEWLVLKFILDESSKLKNSKLLANLCIIIPIVAVILMTAFEINIFLKLFICISMTFVLYKYNYQTTISKCLFLSLFYWMVLIGFDVLGSTIVIALNKIANLNILLELNTFRLEVLILSKSLLLLIVPIVKGIKFREEINRKGYFLISAPIFANIICIVMLTGFMFKGSNFNYTKSTVMLLLSYILLLSNVSLVIIISRILKDNEMRSENIIIKEKMDMQYKYYSNLCKFEMGTVYETKNVILDVLLTEKKEICDANNIELYVDIDFSKCLFVDITDVCCIFSNMIDASIEECKKIKGRHRTKTIKISGNVVNKFYVIKCEYPEFNIVVYDKDTIITDDQDETSKRGIIINSMKKSIKKYHGEMVISSQENFSMIMTILIPLGRKLSKGKL
jgi:hypothetical protein